MTTQAQILELIGALRDDFDSAIIMITHDLGVVAELCDEVIVMYAGRVVERGSVFEIFERPQHPYTWGLLGSLPGSQLGPRQAALRSRARRRACSTRRRAAGSIRAART